MKVTKIGLCLLLIFKGRLIRRYVKTPKSILNNKFMNTKKILALIVVPFLLFASCSSDNDSDDPAPAPTPAEFSINKNTVDFGAVEISTQKKTELTITNTGEEDLALKNYTFSGSNASEFSTDAGETEETVQAGKTYNFTIVFEPAEEGNKTAVLTITSNVGEHKIELSASATLDPNAIVNIPDANFKKVLLEQGTTVSGTVGPYRNSKIDTNDDGEIQISEARAYESALIASSVLNDSYNISDLTGIEAFVNIKALWVSKNQLTSLDISNNTALEYLICDNNQLTSLDISNNTALEYLNCAANELTDLDISKNTALVRLFCYNNQLSDLDTSKNPDLEFLICNDNQLSTIDVTNNTSLSRLRVHNNKLTHLDVSKNTGLKDLNCNNNQLTSLNLSNAAGLEKLLCEHNELTNIDISQNTLLKELKCSYNALTTLDASKNTSLESLNCGYNQLASLDVSQNTALKYLYSYNNQLTSLDVSKNMALEFFYCYENQLTSLDVSNNPSLRMFNCHSNQLTHLNVANGNNHNLTQMEAVYNNLTCIQIDPGFTPPDNSNWIKDATAAYSENCL
ncbi:choice-of-anchor D domain-containing protein [Sinomicrobium pectinilyticum]|uniref:Choice-of-anchor D domain-containing protein n=1 Tax=Sinomicrobium pectinilyticum TaxID=1084421 RepID=A0A3N0EJ12_SINP1|nr:choice-of-anchor D domain-containing protein [Sinomicrobium pectinilyticum]RNL87888.1 choice-of-anchor D domain-containing protein [Sinomicrobium pectinilyticum]